VELDFNQLRELLTLLNQTDVAEMILKSNEFELTLRKGRTEGDRPAPVAPAPAGGNIPSVLSTPVAPAPLPVPNAPPSINLPVPPPNSASERMVDIISPMVGTFYRAPGPDEPPFVEVGDRVRSGQTVCIIEAMKLMNELEAELAGEVIEILARNGEPVEYGQPLLRLKPD
jgi:acetyl-CoA carboxylase biotin carboxyl carrier protein